MNKVEELENIIRDAITVAAWQDSRHHSDTGWGVYEMDPEIVDLIKRANACGIDVPPIYEGAIWPTEKVRVKRKV